MLSICIKCTDQDFGTHRIARAGPIFSYLAHPHTSILWNSGMETYNAQGRERLLPALEYLLPDHNHGRRNLAFFITKFVE